MLGNSRLVEKYHIEESIGNGSFSIVYRAVEKSCDRRVAIKALQRDAYEKGAYQYALGEISALGRIWEHPNIVSIHTVEPGDDKYLSFLVMEYVESSLREFMEKGKLPLSCALAFAYDICSGLAYAHHQDVIHRDIKPRNILVTSDMTAKVSDFGVALVRQASYEVGSTFAGTRRYMAPEQYDESYDHRVDIFAVGVLLWEMATGTFPYEAESQKEIRAKKRYDVTPPERLPQSVRDLLDISLRTNPFERYRSMDEMRDAIGEVLMTEYEQFVQRRITSGLPLNPNDATVYETRKKLRISPPAALSVEHIAQHNHRQALEAQKRDLAWKQAIESSESLMMHICRKNHDLAELAMGRLKETGVVPLQVAELLEMLMETSHPSTDLGHRLPSQLRPSPLDRTPMTAPVEIVRDEADGEQSALHLIEVGRQHEVANRWRKARGAYREGGKGYVGRALECQSHGDNAGAARFFTKAAEAFKMSHDTRKALAYYEQAAERWLERAKGQEESGSRDQAAEAYRAAARSYDQAGKPKLAQKHYNGAAALFYQGAHDAMKQGLHGTAESLGRVAVGLSAGASGWAVAREARQLLDQIQQGRR
ncbi:MAG: serine/threonine-protein kinase [Candidatus Poribacteria bacterium]|nr:serine/threonine-protein kinase [Candidatus Poribacteria bacterium]